VTDQINRAHPRASILESVSDTARVLLTAALLSSTALGVYVWMLTRLDSDGPERLIGQLRLAQWAALALAATGAVSIGLAIANETAPLGTVEVAINVGFMVIAALVLQREPRSALFLVAGGFVLHALTDIAHRPGGLTPIAPHWYAVGGAICDLYFAAACYWVARK
jgi:hypothetical protein